MSHFYFAVDALKEKEIPFHVPSLKGLPELLVKYLCGTDGRMVHDAAGKTKVPSYPVQERDSVGKEAWGTVVSLLQVLFDRHIKPHTKSFGDQTLSTNNNPYTEEVELERWVGCYEVS